MKTKIFLSMFAVIAALAIVFAASAFNNKDTISPVETVEVVTPKVTQTYYFEYTPPSNFAEGALEDPLNWSYVGTSPGSDPCPNDNNRVCVSHADLAVGLTPSQAITAFTNFLKAEMPAATGATNYLTDPGNIDHYKP